MHQQGVIFLEFSLAINSYEVACSLLDMPQQVCKENSGSNIHSSIYQYQGQLIYVVYCFGAYLWYTCSRTSVIYDLSLLHVNNAVSVVWSWIQVMLTALNHIPDSTVLEHDCHWQSMTAIGNSRVWSSNHAISQCPWQFSVTLYSLIWTCLQFWILILILNCVEQVSYLTTYYWECASLFCSLPLEASLAFDVLYCICFPILQDNQNVSICSMYYNYSLCPVIANLWQL